MKFFTVHQIIIALACSCDREKLGKTVAILVTVPNSCFYFKDENSLMLVMFYSDAITKGEGNQPLSTINTSTRCCARRYSPFIDDVFTKAPLTVHLLKWEVAVRYQTIKGSNKFRWWSTADALTGKKKIADINSAARIGRLLSCTFLVQVQI